MKNILNWLHYFIHMFKIFLFPSKQDIKKKLKVRGLKKKTPPKAFLKKKLPHSKSRTKILIMNKQVKKLYALIKEANENFAEFLTSIIYFPEPYIMLVFFMYFPYLIYFIVWGFVGNQIHFFFESSLEKLLSWLVHRPTLFVVFGAFLIGSYFLLGFVFYALSVPEFFPLLNFYLDLIMALFSELQSALSWILTCFSEVFSLIYKIIKCLALLIYECARRLYFVLQYFFK